MVRTARALMRGFGSCVSFPWGRMNNVSNKCVTDKQESKLHRHLYECVDSKNGQVRLIFGIVYQVEIHQLFHFYIAGLHAIYNICKEHGYVLPNSHCGDN